MRESWVLEREAGGGAVLKLLLLFGGGGGVVVLQLRSSYFSVSLFIFFIFCGFFLVVCICREGKRQSSSFIVGSDLIV